MYLSRIRFKEVDKNTRFRVSKEIMIANSIKTM